MKKMKKHIIGALVLITVFVVFVACFEKSSTTTSDNRELKQITVSRVVDGDTFVYAENGTEIRARLIGIDTPESVAPEESGKTNTEEGKIASEYSRTRIEGKTCFIEYDVSIYDTYNRELVYLYLEDGTLFQDELLSMGYAQVMTIPPNVKYSDHFVELEREAVENGIGFWK